MISHVIINIQSLLERDVVQRSARAKLLSLQFVYQRLGTRSESTRYLLIHYCESQDRTKAQGPLLLWCLKVLFDH